MRRGSTTTAISVLLTFLLLGGVFAATSRARVLVGGREVIAAPAPVFDGKRVLVPVGALRSFGASHILSQDRKTVTVMAQNGASADVHTVDVEGTPMAPLDRVLQIVGADSAWDSAQRVLTVTARVLSVEFADGVLRVNCSIPVACSSHLWDNKLVVEIPGARLATDAREVYIGTPLVQRARLGESQPNTTRVVLDLNKAVGWRVESEPIASQLVVRVDETLPRPTASVEPAAKPWVAGPFTVATMRIDTVDDERFELVISTSSKGAASVDYGVAPPQVVLNLPRAALSDTFEAPDANHPLIGALKVAPGPGAVKVIIDLTRIAAYSTVVDESSIRLVVRRPEKSGGSLADKLVVIDPGHGGSQRGAAFGSVYEKDLNFRISMELVAALEKEGARTLLTRSGDITLGLAERPQTAVDAGADFFISIHCNSNGTPNSASGVETYYHADEPDPRAMAYAVHAAVIKATGMRDMKARSDSRLYASGLAVLRRLKGTGIPGVLLECGYLNHSGDRGKLVDANFRKKLAAGVVAGLKAYVEGTPIK